ncbi:MAG: xanthine dehydrogenase family protein subunit M [Candidatus Caldatribacteriota bacterium]|nr:xanthine dehydrogenase family protein subunit M [Candidatus Caldatribacteriota bacterium]
MQTDTKILAQEFEYLAPKTLDKALDLLSEYKDKNIKILSGGTDLLVKMKTINLEVDYLMNIKDISKINFIDINQGLVIGAVTPLSHIAREEKIKVKYTALYEGIKAMAAPSIRNMGTIAGNICNASPAADTVPPLIVYGTELKLQSKRGERTVLLEDFITGVGETILKTDELITEIIIPEINKNTGSAFLKKSRVKADLSKINLAVYLEREGDVCKNCKIVFGSVDIKALRAEETENLLKGKTVNSELINKAAWEVSREIKPIDDIRSTADYRITMSKEMLKDGLELSWERAGD